MSEIKNLKPENVWQYFDKITQIPRPSHHETQIQQFVLSEAERLGLFAEKDAAGNVLVRKPATKGYENHAGIILQGHLDMVAQKNDASTHDFEKDPIETHIEGEWVKANGTTLGADNGMGVAAILAVLADDSIAHPALEALFTATEETGMLGAEGLQPDWLTGKYLLNLDSETLGEVCIGCAGGVDADFTLPVQTEKNQYKNGYCIKLVGLKGGHSGVDIDKQRGNAIKLLIDALFALKQNEEFAISDIKGGSLRNAIPRSVEVIIQSNNSLKELANKLNRIASDLKQGLREEDQNMNLTIEDGELTSDIWQQNVQDNILTLLKIFPNGVDRMSVDQKGVVETSVNLAKAVVENGKLSLHALLRSLRDDARDDLAERLALLFKLGGGQAEFTNPYSGWQPNMHSPLNQIVIDKGNEVLPEKTKLSVIHAGLECGIMGDKYPQWEMISFGPTIEMPHSPDERVHIKSVAYFWDWLILVLRSL